MPWSTEKRKQWYKENRIRLLEEKRIERISNPEKFRERNRIQHAKWREQRNARKRTPEYRAKAREERKRNRHRIRRYWLRKKYGITPEQYESMYQSQNGCCAICNRPNEKNSRWGTKEKYLQVDHCHENKKVRGLLCYYCNVAIGLMDHDVQRIKKAADYLL